MKHFARVNEVWGDTDYRFIITTSTTMIGVNYDNANAPFDCGVLFGSAFGSNVRDTMQGLYRIRNFMSDEIVLCNRTGYNTEKFMARSALERNYDYIESFTGQEATAQPEWRVENLLHTEIESGMSAYHYHEMLDAYFQYTNYTRVERALNVEDAAEEPQLTGNASSVIVNLREKFANETFDNLAYKIVTYRATAEDKQMYHALMLELFFIEEYAESHVNNHIDTLRLDKLLLLQCVKCGSQPTYTRYGKYFQDTHAVRLGMLNLLFQKLDITVTNTFIGHKIPIEIINKLYENEREEMQRILQAGLKEKTKNFGRYAYLSALRKMFTSIHLDIEQVQYGIKHTVTHYKIIDFMGIWDHLIS